jgi:hypothetical protein
VSRRPIGIKHLNHLAREFRKEEAKRADNSGRMTPIAHATEEGLSKAAAAQVSARELAVTTLVDLFLFYTRNRFLPDDLRMTLTTKKVRLKWRNSVGEWHVTERHPAKKRR